MRYPASEKVEIIRLGIVRLNLLEGKGGVA